MPLSRPWFSTDPQPASISPTVNISIVFICAVLDCGGIIYHPAIKNDSSAIPQPTEWQQGLRSPPAASIPFSFPRFPVRNDVKQQS
jgi:hypothetical protein